MGPGSGPIRARNGWSKLLCQLELLGLGGIGRLVASRGFGGCRLTAGPSPGDTDRLAVAMEGPEVVVKRPGGEPPPQVPGGGVGEAEVDPNHTLASTTSRRSALPES